MKKIIATEEVAQLAFCLVVLFQMPDHITFAWLIPAFFIPDIFAIGFLVNNKMGTLFYNFSHHKLVAILLFAFGVYFSSTALKQAGIISYAHSSFDRAIGYGLKYLGNPSKTHLGYICKEKGKNPPDLF